MGTRHHKNYKYVILKIDNDQGNLWYGPFFNYIHSNIIITIILHYADELLVGIV